MAFRTTRFRPDGRSDRRRVRQTGRFAGAVALIALGIALGGCGAVDVYRSLAGIDKNDPDPQTAPFAHNLEEGEALPYPNLASVPPPPVLATSTTERQK